MQKIPALLGLCCLALTAMGQAPTSVQPFNGKRPKLVVGLVIDQMRWDYLYRYHARYGSGGFKRMLAEGFSAENTMIPYAQTVTAAGHACVYTGSVPAINGIMGNDWYDPQLKKTVYCVEDDSVQVIGGTANSEPMSPRNLWVSTISDELRLATNFRSKVVGVALKDRGSILPAGYTGTAYWYEGKTGHFISSSWYMKQLPAWVNQFNQRNLVDSLYQQPWKTLYPITSYKQSDDDDVPYEGKSPADKGPVFPHELSSYIGRNYDAIRTTPFGNTLTLAFAKAAMQAEGLGKDEDTDLLAVSLSSPDYIGHQYGPNSIEMEDNYLRLDQELAAFFAHLDKEVGKGQYLVFLTADHAVAHTPLYLAKKGFPISPLSGDVTEINKKVYQRFGVPNIIRSSANYHLHLNHTAMDTLRKNKKEIIDYIVQELKSKPHIYSAWDNAELQQQNLPAVMKEKFVNGFNPKLGGDIQLVLKAGFFYGWVTGTTHGAWYPYDSHIPAVFMGWGVQPGRTTRPTSMADIAPTLAAMLRIQMPSGCIGQPITELLPMR